jgi:hypothetical protein
MDGGRASRRRNWIVVALMAIGLPILACLG